MWFVVYTSHASVAKASESLRGDARVEPILADLTKWMAEEKFDAMLFLSSTPPCTW